MAFKFDETKAMETGATATVGKKVLDTGVYDAVINTVEETTAGTGAKGVNINFTVSGAKYPNTIYGLWYEKANGDMIDFQAAKLHHLLGIAGGKGPTIYKKTIEVKDGTKVIDAWKETDNLPVKMAIQKVIKFYNGEVREENEIVEFMYPDGFTYSEKKSGVKEPKQLKYYSSKLQDKEDKSYKEAVANGLLDNDAESSEEEESTGSLL